MEDPIRRIASNAASVPASSPEEKDRYHGYSGSENDHSTLKEPSDTGSVRQTSGVSRMEAFARATQGRKGVLIGLAVAVYVCNWVYSMEHSTTYAYAIWATSDFQDHSSGISAVNIASQIISSVCLPCELSAVICLCACS